jgi:hypothetical protein
MFELICCLENENRIKASTVAKASVKGMDNQHI